MIRKEKQAGLGRRLRFLAPLGPGQQIYARSTGLKARNQKSAFIHNCRQVFKSS